LPMVCSTLQVSPIMGMYPVTGKLLKAGFCPFTSELPYVTSLPSPYPRAESHASWELFPKWLPN
jgi:hypothetical protein